MTATIHVGDALAVLRTLPDASVHCCVTSPPYWGLRDYGVEGQIGLEETPHQFVEALVAVFAEVRRVLRPDGVCWMNLGDSYSTHAGQRNSDKGHNIKPKNLLGMPWRVAFALQADGWWLRSDCIWSKPNPMPESVEDRPTKAHEYVFLLTKAERYFYDAFAVRQRSTGRECGNANPVKGAEHDPKRMRTRAGLHEYEPTGGANLRTVWTIATQPFKDAHFATFPQRLADQCIQAGTSAHGCCSACGAPWERVVERRLVRTPKACVYRSCRPDHADANDQGSNRQRDGHVPGMVRADIDKGWRAACECVGATVVPCRVLDPFNGAGTTGLSATLLGRDYIGIELNPDYAAMARKRIADEMPLFASRPLAPTRPMQDSAPTAAE